jgi:hypothetical protein
MSASSCFCSSFSALFIARSTAAHVGDGHDDELCLSRVQLRSIGSLKRAAAWRKS